MLTFELQRVFILLCWKMEPRCRQANNRKVRAVCQRERERAAPQDPCSICLALAARARDRSPVFCLRARPPAAAPALVAEAKLSVEGARRPFPLLHKARPNLAELPEFWLHLCPKPAPLSG